MPRAVPTNQHEPLPMDFGFWVLRPRSETLKLLESSAETPPGPDPKPPVDAAQGRVGGRRLDVAEVLCLVPTPQKPNTDGTLIRNEVASGNWGSAMSRTRQLLGKPHTGKSYLSIRDSVQKESNNFLAESGKTPLAPGIESKRNRAEGRGCPTADWCWSF